MKPVGVVVFPVPSPGRSTPTKKRIKKQTKPISEQEVPMTVEDKQGDRASEPTKAERPPVVGLCTANDSRSTKANPVFVARGLAGSEVEESMLVTSGQVRHIGHNTVSSPH